MDFKKILALIPVLGAAFRKDETKSEYDITIGGIAAIAALPDVPGWSRAVGIGIAIAAYIWARTSKKNAETTAH